jgi:DNA-binding response OmpR family regulator
MTPEGLGCRQRPPVTTLRGKIEADPHAPVYIQTIRDIGYRFEAGEE